MRLSGSRAIVTGAGRGMGLDIVRVLAEEGADLALIGRDVGRLETIAAFVHQVGRKAVVVAADLTQEEMVIRMVDQVREELGEPVDILVNALGVNGPGPMPIWEVEPEDFISTMDGNLKSVFLLMKHILPQMVRARSGKVVNIGGTYGHKGTPERAVYGMSKWALRGLTRSAALEAGRFGVRVNLVAPGPVEGDRIDFQVDEAATRKGVPASDVRAAFTSQVVLGQMSTGLDIANAVLFLVSNMSSNITGQEIIVDGGSVI